jgi:thermitase
MVRGNMQRFLFLFIVFLIPNLVWAKFGRRYVEGELIVKYKVTASSTSQKQTLQSQGATNLKNFKRKNWSHVKLSKDQDVQSALESFKSDPNVEYVQPNYIYHAALVPSDPYFNRQWGLKNDAQTIFNFGLGGPDIQETTNNPGTIGFDIKAIRAWDNITDCSSAVVAILDSGVNYNQEDLTSNLWKDPVTGKYGWDFVDGDDDPIDLNGHGTHIAGIIGAIGDNSVGTTGVCWKAKIMTVRVLDALGQGTTADIVSGINYAVSNGAKVINLSLTGSNFDQAESDAISSAQSSGVLVVVAAGNDGVNVDDPATPIYPCKFTQSNILCVGALSQNYTQASYSNYGPNSVDIGAPGVNIVSTWPGIHNKFFDDLTNGWVKSSQWGYKQITFGTSKVNALVTPPLYDHNTKKYYNNKIDYAWKNFDLSGSIAAIVDFYIMYDSEFYNDYLNVMSSPKNADPTDTANSGTLLDDISGTSNGSREERRYDISSDISPTTSSASFGFRFTTDSSVNNFGMNITNFSITTLSPSSSIYNIQQGTSMAAPYVSAVAAMLFAFNPSYTYTEVRNALKAGVDVQSSLAGKSTTSGSLNAYEALRYISQPTGGVAVKKP